MVNVFREVRRVLRRDGTCWLNIGDSYHGGGGGNYGSGLSSKQGGQHLTNVRNRLDLGEIKPKDLVGIPWRLAFALQADGWYLRSDIIWAKPNPMPESVTDRPTKAHEYLFLLTRESRYFYDADAIREPAEWARWGDQTNGKHEGSGSAAGWIGANPKKALTSRRSPLIPEQTKQGVGRQGRDSDTFGLSADSRGRNKRSVWEIPTEAFAAAHFATFPTKLVEPCVLAGTSEKGCCPECGAPWERETERQLVGGHAVPNARAFVSDARRGPAVGGSYEGASHVSGSYDVTTTGWRPTCECFGHIEVIPEIEVIAGTDDRVKGEQRIYVWDRPQPDPVPATVCDIFMGSGTTALVARRLGRKTIGIELSQEYSELAAKRLSQLSLLADAR